MFRTASMLVNLVPSPICTGKSSVSILTVPAGMGLIVEARTPATCSSFSPAATALARSTLTWTTGWLAARFVVDLAGFRHPCHGLHHGVAGLPEVLPMLAALMVMSTVEEVPKPPCWEPTVILPASATCPAQRGPSS